MPRVLYFATFLSFAGFLSQMTSAADSPRYPRYVRTLVFEADSMIPKDKALLSVVASWAQKHQEMVAVVEGYNCEADLKGRKADAPETKALLLRLAEERASKIREELVSRGVDKSRLSTIAYGMADPGDPCAAKALFYTK